MRPDFSAEPLDTNQRARATLRASVRLHKVPGTIGETVEPLQPVPFPRVVFSLGPFHPQPFHRGAHSAVTPIIVIPSRMASTRLPGKPLADIHGKPMIVHVLDRAREADIGPAAVAWGDPEIAEAVEPPAGSPS